MRIAVLLSGHLRTAGRLIDQWAAVAPLCDLYVSTWNYLGTWSAQGGLHGTVRHATDEVVTPNVVKAIFPSAIIHMEDYDTVAPDFEAQTQRAREWQNTFGTRCSAFRCLSYYSAYYKRRQAFALLENSGQSYDVVVMTRPDVLLDFPIDIDSRINAVFAAPNEVPDPDNKLWINDIVLAASQTNAQYIAEIYNRYHDILDTAILENRPDTFFDPHALIKHQLDIANIGMVETLHATIIR